MSFEESDSLTRLREASEEAARECRRFRAEHRFGLVYVFGMTRACLLYTSFSVLASATQYCYVLREGSIVDAGRTDALLADPADEYTAMLVTAARALSLHVDGSGGANHD